MKKKEQKAKANKKTIKQKAQDWSDAMKLAYAMGYEDGYNSYDKMPKRKGVIVAATSGYENGVSAHKKRVKNSEKIQKIDEERKRVSDCLAKKKPAKGT